MAESSGPKASESPPIDHDDITPSAASRNAGRTIGYARSRRTQPQAHGIGDRLTHGQCAGEGDREQEEGGDVWEDPRGRKQFHDQRRDQHPQAHSAGTGRAVVQPDGSGVTLRVQVQQGGTGRTQGEPGRQSLQGARREQPDH